MNLSILILWRIMKKRIISLSIALLLAGQFASAQQTFFVLSKAGDLAAYPVTHVTFSNDMFTFAYGGEPTLTQNSVSSSVSVAFASDEFKTLEQAVEVGICYSSANAAPTVDDTTTGLGTALGNYTFSIDGLEAGTTYYYRAYMKLNSVVYYGDLQSATTPAA